MVDASLHRLSTLSDLKSVSEKLEARLTLVYQETLNDDANDEFNKIIADIGRGLVLQHTKVPYSSMLGLFFQKFIEF
ncbi:unnamed protein product [Rotaria sp. Silwood2]|nr:unnamed protein product [Rotaria sp. Silwood2]CAF3378131.1 unnamed protein product [Rotaria sp. Silwood2]CAF4443170.1 unnamed protein product [Rotaria sp. Silwood2]CAF4495633.1 unnamed protein product [Rotaria sp. Silwood2]